MAKARRTASGTWGTIVFVLIGVGLIFLAILPIGSGPTGWPGPDLLIATTFAWVIRRPDIAPVWVVAGLFLLADFMLFRAPGLMACAMVLASEYIRGREDLTVEVPFALEWSVASSMIACVIVGTSAVLVIFGAPAMSIGAMLVKLILTILIYPVIVLCARYLLGITRPGKPDEIGFGSRP